MDETILELHPWQVWDSGRGCFVVGLKATKQRHRGLPVYTDRTGRKFVIRGLA